MMSFCPVWLCGRKFLTLISFQFLCLYIDIGSCIFVLSGFYRVSVSLCTVINNTYTCIECVSVSSSYELKVKTLHITE